MTERDTEAADDWMREHMPDPDHFSFEDTPAWTDVLSMHSGGRSTGEVEDLKLEVNRRGGTRGAA